MSDDPNPAAAVSPPQLETMTIEVENGIGTLTLNRPDTFNAMSPQMLAEMMLIGPWLADSSGLRALIVTGAGPAFSGGGDVNWFRDGFEKTISGEMPVEGLVADVRRGADVLHQGIVDFRRIPFPVIGAINGVAAGAGFSLALLCDIRVASENAAFTSGYRRIAVSPDGGMTYFLPRIVGPSRAVRLLLEDPLLSAGEALELGLVDEVVPADELAERAREKAETLASRPAYFVRKVKELVHQSLDNSLADHLQLERHAIAEAFATDDTREGVKAFFEGRKPEFGNGSGG